MFIGINKTYWINYIYIYIYIYSTYIYIYTSIRVYTRNIDINNLGLVVTKGQFIVDGARMERERNANGARAERRSGAYICPRHLSGSYCTVYTVQYFTVYTVRVHSTARVLYTV